MSFGDPNPYASPQPPQAPKTEYTPGEPWTVDYFGGFSAALTNPNWFVSALLCGLILLVPILGPIVALGYAFDVADHLHRTNGRLVRDFSFDRFSDYMTRGVGPFLVSLVVGLICGLPVIGVTFVALFGSMAAFQNDPEALQNALPLIQAGSQPVQILLNVFVFTICLPFMLRGGLSGDVGQSFKFELGWAMLSKTLLPCFLLSLIYNLAGGLLGFLGCLACCVGAIPAMGFMYSVLGWNGYQLYRFSLSQGLPPIPLKPSPEDLKPGGLPPAYGSGPGMP